MTRNVRVSQAVGHGRRPRAWVRLLEEHSSLLMAFLGVLAAYLVPGNDGRIKLAALLGMVGLVYVIQLVVKNVLREEYEEAHHRRRALREARSLLREKQRVLTRVGKAASISAEIKADVVSRGTNLEAAVAERDYAKIRQQAHSLDEALDTHFARYRKSTGREYAESIGVAVVIALFLRSFVVEAFKIPSGSMIPTLQVGDHIFVNKFVYGLGVPITGIKFWKFGAPQRGDVIVFKYPADIEKDFIKRVVAVAGDTVLVKGEDVFVNGEKLARNSLGRVHYEDMSDEIVPPQVEDKVADAFEQIIGKKHFEIYNDIERDEEAFAETCKYGCDKAIKVPAGHVFVMGDNRDNSLDSRAWGFVPEEFIKGRALFVWLSWDATQSFFHGIRFRRFGFPVR